MAADDIPQNPVPDIETPPAAPTTRRVSSASAKELAAMLTEITRTNRATAAQLVGEANALRERLRVLQRKPLLVEPSLVASSDQERQLEMLDLIPDGYLVTDVNGIIQSANRAAALLLGINDSHLIGKPFLNFVTIEDRFALRRTLLSLRDASEATDKTEFVRVTPRKRDPFDASLRFTGIRHSQSQELLGIRWLLRDISERSRAELERYRLLLDAVEDYAFMLMDEQGNINGWNRGAEVIFGYSEEEARGLNYAILFPADYRKMAALEIAEARAGGSYRCENWLVRASGARFFVQGVMLALPNLGTGRAGYAKIIRDMTEARKQQEALRLSEARLQMAMRAGGAGSWDWDLRDDTHTWSAGYMTLLGLDTTHDFASYEIWRASLHPDDRDEAERRVREAIKTGHELTSEYRVATPEGASERWLLSLGKALHDSSGHSYRLTGITMDITERKRAEQELAEAKNLLEQRVRERTAELEQTNTRLQTEIAERKQAESARLEIAQRLVRAQEEERGRISRELHDQTGQQLTAFSLRLRALEDSYPGNAVAQTHLSDLRQIADSLVRDMHRIAVELRPTALDDLGLIRALHGYIDDWMNRTNISVDFQVSDIPEQERLPEAMETALYRIAQESLNNIAKHSGANHVAVLLSCQTEQVMLIVEDNGRGFPVENENAVAKDVPSRPKLGLAGIRERATLLGGSVDIESEPDNGTTIFVRLPLQTI